MEPVGDFPDDMHGTTRGKLYTFKDDNRCAECIVEAWERQTYGGLGAGLPRKVLASVRDRVHPPFWPGDGCWVQFVKIAQ